VSTPGAIAPLVISTGIDAIEIHTKVGRLAEFQRLWQVISPWVEQLKVLAISCPDGEGIVKYLQSISDLISPVPYFNLANRRPSYEWGYWRWHHISTIKLGQKVLTAKLPGYVQLAGGTNSYTVAKLKAMALLNRVGEHSDPQTPRSSASIAGVAYGSYARVMLAPIIEQLENQGGEK
jgi:hypothetical protein